MKTLEEELKALLIDTSPKVPWSEICAIFLFNDDTSKLKTYFRNENAPWKNFDAGDFELLDWFDSYLGVNNNVKSIKSVISKSGEFTFKIGYEPCDIFINSNDYELLEKL